MLLMRAIAASRFDLASAKLPLRIAVKAVRYCHSTLSFSGMTGLAGVAEAVAVALGCGFVAQLVSASASRQSAPKPTILRHPNVFGGTPKTAGEPPALLKEIGLIMGA